MRKEFEMSEADLANLLESCRPVPPIMLQCRMPSSPQENANRAWERLGAKMGFDSTTVQPCGRGDRFFTAEAIEMLATQRSAPQTRKIITSHVRPPVPTTAYDWCAYYDDEGAEASNYGWGASEQAAIKDLKTRFGEEEAA